MLLLDYIPILVMIALGLAFAVGNMTLSFLIGPRKDSAEKLDTYECGMPPVGSPRERFSVKFFIVAILFVIFDIEIAYLFLWGIVFKQLGWYGIGVMSFFMVMLVASLLYEMKKGVLEWASKTK
jgi:NADH-quinone oxidoreductase subunit A